MRATSWKRGGISGRRASSGRTRRMPPGLATTEFLPSVALRVVVRLDRDARRASGRRTRSRPRAGDGVAVDLALGLVAAEDADAERVRRRRCPSTSPIDISVIVIAAQRRAADVVVADVTLDEVRDDPFAPARDRAALDHAQLQVEGEGDVDPLRPGPGRRRRSAVADHRPRCAARGCRRAARPTTQTPSSTTSRRVVDVDPVLAADDRDVADRDVVRRDRRCRRDDRARLADERLRVVDARAAPGATPVRGGRSGGCVAVRRRRPRRASTPTAAAARQRRRGRARRRPRRTSAGRAGSTAWPSSWAASQPTAKSASAGASGARDRRARARRHRRGRARARRAAARASPAGTASSAVVERRRRARRRPRASAPTSSSGHQRARERAARARPASGRAARREPRLERGPSACRTRRTLRRKPRAAYFAPTSVSAAGNAHCAGDAGERERPRLVGQRRHGRVGREHDPAVRRSSSPCSATSRRAAGRARSRAEAGGADRPAARR